MCSIKKLKDDLNELGLLEHSSEAVLIYLAATSRKMSRKVSVTSIGSSSVGKTYTQNAVLQLIPPDEVLNLAGMTTAALLRMSDLKDKIVVMNEHFGDAKFESLLRQLISEGRILFEFVERGEKVEREVKGPTVVLDATIESEMIDFQNLNRSLVLNFRLTPQELQAQAARIKRRHTEHDLSRSKAAMEIADWHHWHQDNLQPNLQVVIPFAEDIGFTPVHPHHKRLLENFLSVVETIAFLDQHNREKKARSGIGEFIEATVQDFEEARRLFQCAHVETGTDAVPDDAVCMLLALKAYPTKFCTDTPYSLYTILKAFKDDPKLNNVCRHWTAKQVRRNLEILRNSQLITRMRGPHNIAMYRLVEFAWNLTIDELQNCLSKLKLPQTNKPSISTDQIGQFSADLR